MKRITETEAQEIRGLRAEGYQLKEIAEKTGRSITAIHRAIHRPQAKPEKQSIGSYKRHKPQKDVAPIVQSKHRPMLALIGDRDEVTKTIKELFS